MLPIPAFCNCQTAATSKFAAGPLEPMLPFGTGGKVAGRQQTGGRTGAEHVKVRQKRPRFSCFSRWLAAATSSRCEAISGRLLIATGTSSAAVWSPGIKVT